MKDRKKGILLINLGSPASPELKDVRKFLREFLNDKYVIDMPAFFRFLLVNGIIVPFRTQKSTQSYQKLWQGKSTSPILEHSQNVLDQLRTRSENKVQYYLAMRYGEPSIKNAIQQIRNDNINQLTVLPLYPQYAQSTTQTVVEKVKSEIRKVKLNIETNFIQDFYNHTGYINALVSNIKKHNYSEFDHILFSFHGLPLSHIDKIHKEIESNKCECTTVFPAHGKRCYKAQCYETARLIARQIKLESDRYSISFQSHLSEKWMKPFTSITIQKLAKEGVKRLLVVAPSFVCDNLETIVEIDRDMKQIFKNYGGDKLLLVEGLNSKEIWIKGIEEILKNTVVR